MLNSEVLIITSPEVAIEFFQKRDVDFEKWTAMAKVMQDLFGYGLLTAEGDTHRVKTDRFNQLLLN